MTAGATSGKTGFRKDPGGFGSLSPSSFEYEGNTYAVEELTVDASNNLDLKLDRQPPEGKTWVLLSAMRGSAWREPQWSQAACAGASAAYR